MQQKNENEDEEKNTQLAAKAESTFQNVLGWLGQFLQGQTKISLRFTKRLQFTYILIYNTLVCSTQSIFLVVTNLTHYKIKQKVPMTFYTLTAGLTDSAITFRTFLIMIRTLWPKALLQPGSSLAWTTKVRLFSKPTLTHIFPDNI